VAAPEIDLGLVEKLHRLMPSRSKKGECRAFPPNPEPPWGRGLRPRLHRDENTVVRPAAELDTPLDEGEEGVVAAHADIVAGVVLGAALAHQDIAGEHGLVAVALDAEAASGGVAPVARA